ncbi:MAG TPA: hypothetical protein V6C91_20870 [Coleofasciculaceae cyanobacterium]
MKSIRFSLSAVWRSLRLVVAAAVGALILFSNATPAYSLDIPNPFAGDKSAAQTTNPTKGEDKLLGVEEGAQKAAIREGDRDLLSREQVMKKSAEGINEVQGAADIEKMKRPSNSQGETIEGILRERLEDATGQQ